MTSELPGRRHDVRAERALQLAGALLPAIEVCRRAGVHAAGDEGLALLHPDRIDTLVLHHRLQAADGGLIDLGGIDAPAAVSALCLRTLLRPLHEITATLPGYLIGAPRHALRVEPEEAAAFRSLLLSLEDTQEAWAARRAQAVSNTAHKDARESAVAARTAYYLAYCETLRAALPALSPLLAG